MKQQQLQTMKANRGNRRIKACIESIFQSSRISNTVCKLPATWGSIDRFDTGSYPMEKDNIEI
jgi:hypothetical protein